MVSGKRWNGKMLDAMSLLHKSRRLVEDLARVTLVEACGSLRDAEGAIEGAIALLFRAESERARVIKRAKGEP